VPLGEKNGQGDANSFRLALDNGFDRTRDFRGDMCEVVQ
jgi:hypothetical protein